MKVKKGKKSDKTGSTKSSKSSKSTAKSSKKAERDAKKAARKGDGSFPDIIVLTKEENDGKQYFAAHDGATLNTLYDDGAEVAVYKLRRVSTVIVNRKIAR